MPLQTELSSVILKIIDLIVDEGHFIELELRRQSLQPESIERTGKIVELRIRKQQIKRIRKGVFAILKQSENHIILSTIQKIDN